MRIIPLSTELLRVFEEFKLEEERLNRMIFRSIEAVRIGFWMQVDHAYPELKILDQTNPSWTVGWEGNPPRLYIYQFSTDDSIPKEDNLS